MEELNLKPNQIITSNHFPLHSLDALKKYLGKCKLGETIFYTPVIKKDIVLKYFNDETLKKFKKFEIDNPSVEYFLLDGSHRTTALDLSKKDINAVSYETNKDIQTAKTSLKNHNPNSNILEHTLEENCEILTSHFTKTSGFMTVEQKTEKLVDHKFVPEHIYNKK